MRMFSVSKLNPKGEYLMLAERMDEQQVLALGAPALNEHGYASWKDDNGNTWRVRADYEQVSAHRQGTRLRGSDVDAYRDWETH